MPAAVIEPGASSYDLTLNGTHTMTMPAGAEVGDLLLLWAGARGLSTSGALTIDRPTGWTRLGTTQVASWSLTGRDGGALFYRVHDGSASVTVNYGAGWSSRFALGMTVVRGQTAAIFTGTTAEAVSVSVPITAADPVATQRAMVVASYMNGAGAFGSGAGWDSVGWDDYDGSLLIGALYQTVEPSSYTMPLVLGVMSSVAVIDSPAGGIYVGHPIGGAGIYAIG